MKYVEIVRILYKHLFLCTIFQQDSTQSKKEEMLSDGGKNTEQKCVSLFCVFGCSFKNCTLISYVIFCIQTAKMSEYNKGIMCYS